MNKRQNRIMAIGVAIGIVIGGVVLILSDRNRIINLEEAIETQYIANQSNYDAMVKTARESAQVTDMYVKDFNKIYKELIEGRNQDENLLFKVINESNPNLDSSVYTTIQRELSANRKMFDNNQKKVLDKIREYNSFVESRFVTSKILNKVKKDASKYIVTSESTREAFGSGVDEEIRLRD